MKKETSSATLHPSLRITLQVLKSKRRARAKEIAEWLGDNTSASTVHNRLEALRRDGFVDREHKGHGWIYFIPKAK